MSGGNGRTTGKRKSAKGNVPGGDSRRLSGVCPPRPAGSERAKSERAANGAACTVHGPSLQERCHALRLGCGDAGGDGQAHDHQCPVFVAWLSRMKPRLRSPIEGASGRCRRVLGVHGRASRNVVRASSCVFWGRVDALRHNPRLVPAAAFAARFEELDLRHASAARRLPDLWCMSALRSGFR